MDWMRTMASRIAGVRYLVRGLDVVQIARPANRPVKEIAKTYFGLGGTLGIDHILAGARTCPAKATMTGRRLPVSGRRYSGLCAVLPLTVSRHAVTGKAGSGCPYRG